MVIFNWGSNNKGSVAINKICFKKPTQDKNCVGFCLFPYCKLEFDYTMNLDLVRCNFGRTHSRFGKNIYQAAERRCFLSVDGQRTHID